jgi:hypothetical protein
MQIRIHLAMRGLIISNVHDVFRKRLESSRNKMGVLGQYDARDQDRVRMSVGLQLRLRELSPAALAKKRHRKRS